MKIKFYHIAIFIVIIFHFLILYNYGISWFGTTILFYLLIYYLLKIVADITFNTKTKDIIIKNVKSTFIILILLEGIIAFVFKLENNYMEKEKGIYFSEYKKISQLNLLKQLGYKNISFAWKYGYKPNTIRQYKSKEFNFHFTTNGLGLRGKLPSIPKDTNEYRIAVLGDSFIEGFGTSNDSTFSVLLEHKLQNKYKEKKISVLNAGVCGSNPIYEIELYNLLIKKYNSNLVLLQTNLSDVSDINFYINKNEMPASEYFYATSHIYRILTNSFLDRNIITSNNVNIVSQRNNNINLIIKNLEMFNTSLKKNGQRLIVVYNPACFEFTNKEPERSKYVFYKERLLKSSIKMINLVEEYEKLKLNCEDYFWKQDAHYKPIGYNLMSKVVANCINLEENDRGN